MDALNVIPERYLEDEGRAYMRSAEVHKATQMKIDRIQTYDDHDNLFEISIITPASQVRKSIGSKSTAEGRNNTIVTKFILLGFSDHSQMKVFLFVLLLGIYLLTLAWDLSLIALIRMDSHLHTPMYFFLSNLSFLDICYVSSTTPKMLSDIITAQKTISFVGCATQYFVFCAMGLPHITLSSVQWG
ncbi:Olfactory receptor 5A2 [Camelus dromedarius]|uniref:Olfactory receptor 5A2 n=1 Tax=Camelus dromedarius TaxID=9838 RepID=A0A5N4DP86_CAMDR|nr:Olfactory receptor 5A2 [Camelus dromedarius]